MISGNTIILCAGPINYSLYPLSDSISNAMIPVNGKPVIGWILEDLIKKRIKKATIVYREDDIHLINFTGRIFSNRIKIDLKSMAAGKTILDSVRKGLESEQSDGLVRIILGDTMISDSFEGKSDFVYVSPAEGARRWCLATIDNEGFITDFLDKQPAGEGRPPALAGYYHLLSGQDVKKCVNESLDSGEREISGMLRRYGGMHKLKAMPVTEWYDFGHIDTLVESRRKLLKPRHFNKLTVNPILNTLTKESSNNQKLQDELDWYKELPEELKVLTPRLLAHETQAGQVRIVQEYYGYPTLAELYVYGNIHPDTWHTILRHLLHIHTEFNKYTGVLSEAEIKHMYTDKTHDRINNLVVQDSYWGSILKADKIFVNGRKIVNFPGLASKIESYADTIAKKASVSIIHGDFCFSNILYDVTHQIARLIDPRGRFGRKGIWGDSRYDIAKLRHSVHEGYDFIQSDMFELHEKGLKFEALLIEQNDLAEVGSDLDDMLKELNYDLKEISFIEGLLYLSMVPLHKGHLDRQKMMYLTGIQLLNEVFDENSI